MQRLLPSRYGSFKSRSTSIPHMTGFLATSNRQLQLQAFTGPDASAMSPALLVETREAILRDLFNDMNARGSARSVGLGLDTSGRLMRSLGIPDRSTGVRSTNNPDSSTADTANLFWKLALVLRGKATPELLETYTEERRPVVHRPSRASETAINYRWSSIVLDDRVKLTDTEHLKRNACIGHGGYVTAGDRAPDAPGLIINNGRQKTSLFDLLSPSEHTILVFHADPGSIQSIVRLVARRLVGIAQVISIRHAASATLPDGVAEAVDSQGLASRAYGAREDELTIMVIRPDGFIGASVHTVAGVAEYFSRIFVV